MSDLSIVIVSWNVCQLLQQCLRSVYGASAALDLQVIVVDNGSVDGSIDMVRGEFPDARLILNTENRGFPAANNQGIEIAEGRCVLLLNPDTEIVGDALAALVAYADAHPDVGVVGPQVLNDDGSIQSSRRRFPTLATAFLESTWLGAFLANTPLKRCTTDPVWRRYYVQDQPDEATLDVDWVKGAALMARQEAVAQVGLLDEGYFMYSEELDWCKRFKDSGWRVVYLPTAQIIHYGGKSSEQVVTARHIHFQTSKVRYFHKHHGSLAGAMVRWFLMGDYAWQIGVEGAKWLVGHKRPLRAERISAYRQVLRSGLSPGTAEGAKTKE